MAKKQVVLLIMDGWGLSPSWGGNALIMNNPKNIDRLWRDYPHKILQALGAVEYGNVVGESRLGHLMIGAGRPVKGYHSLINSDIKSRKFYKNPALLDAFNYAKKTKVNIHLVGMISDGGVHSDIEHLLALLTMAHRNSFNNIYIDAITDGVDTNSTDSLKFVEKINAKIKDVGLGSFSSVGGRKYAMDRDEKWDKIQKYYQCITKGKSPVYGKIEEAISANYRNNLTDENIVPALIKDSQGKVNPIGDKDVIIFFNFREDRATQLTKYLISGEKKGLFKSEKRQNYIVTFINYAKNLPTKVAFDGTKYPNNLSEYLAKMNYKQLKIAESEKMSHVTLFFNGGEDVQYSNEERKIISSPNVASYDLRPEMSSRKLTKYALSAIQSGSYEFIVINYANVDMVAHTGNITAVGQAVTILDQLVGQIVDANLKMKGTTIITADHGNAEQMVNLSKQYSKDRETLHTLNPVPFIVVGPTNKKDLIKTSLSFGPNALAKIITAKDTLADVAPTILELFGLPKPPEMTGHSLINVLE